ATTRMQNLIKDMLDYSRIAYDKTIMRIDCNQVLQTVLKDMAAAISESNAIVKSTNLPVVNGYADLKSLFQNLVSNAIKFRQKDRQPMINVDARQNEKTW